MSSVMEYLIIQAAEKTDGEWVSIKDIIRWYASVRQRGFIGLHKIKC